MTFAYALLFLLYVNLAASIRQAMSKRPTLALLHFSLIPVGLAGLFFGFELNLDPAKGIAMNTPNYAVPLFLAFGLASAAVFGWKTVSILRADPHFKEKNWRFGISLWALVVGIYVAGAVIDHYWFFRDHEHTGIANAAGMGVKEIDCDSMVLAHETSATMEYRCPKSIVWGRDLDQPFVPWPSYEAGESVELKRALDDLRKKSIKLN